MTRINVAILPSELNTKMLIAEHREIKRIPNCIKKGRYNLKGQPEQFTLGTGHVKFFYDKLSYLKRRYECIYSECVKRGYNVTYYGSCFEDLPPNLCNDYRPTLRDRKLLVERIKSKLENYE